MFGNFIILVTKLLKNRKINSFTLIELLVVIAIIGLLASISVSAILSARNRAKDSRVEADLSQIRKEASLIYSESNSYRFSGNELCALDNTLNEANSRHPGLGLIETDVRKYNNNQNVICYSTDNDFCVQSILVDQVASYCVDSGGYAGRVANCSAGNIKCSP